MRTRWVTEFLRRSCFLCSFIFPWLHLAGLCAVADSVLSLSNLFSYHSWTERKLGNFFFNPSSFGSEMDLLVQPCSLHRSSCASDHAGIFTIFHVVSNLGSRPYPNTRQASEHASGAESARHYSARYQIGRTISTATDRRAGEGATRDGDILVARGVRAIRDYLNA